MCELRRFQTLILGFETSRLVYKNPKHKGLTLCASANLAADGEFHEVRDVATLAASSRALLGFPVLEDNRVCPHLHLYLDNFYRLSISIGLHHGRAATYHNLKTFMKHMIRFVAPLCIHVGATAPDMAQEPFLRRVLDMYTADLHRVQ